MVELIYRPLPFDPGRSAPERLRAAGATFYLLTLYQTPLAAAVALRVVPIPYLYLQLLDPFGHLIYGLLLLTKLSQ